MKTKIIFCLFLFLGINLKAQVQNTLSKEADKLKATESAVYSKIEKYSVSKWQDNIDLINHSINEQTKAYLSFSHAREQSNFVWSYFFQALKDSPRLEGHTDWVGVLGFYNIIKEHNKGVVQPVVNVSLKGFTVGAKLIGEDSKLTTVGGVEGILKAETLNDSTIFCISFVSCDNNNNSVRIPEAEAINCLKAINSYYNIDFDEVAAGYLPRGNRRFDADKGNFTFDVEFLKDNIKDPVFSFTVMNLSLNSINLREKRERTNSDF